MMAFFQCLAHAMHHVTVPSARMASRNKGRCWINELSIVTMLALSFYGPVSASPDNTTADQAPHNPQPARLILSHENDIFSGADRDYTSGVRVQFVSEVMKNPEGFAAILSRIAPLFGEDADYRTGFALGQQIYTPEDIDQTSQPEGQHPYAGYLFGAFSVYVNTAQRLDRLGIELGIIGPSAFGEQTQSFIHEISGFDEAQGWDNQLSDELGVKLSYERLTKIPVDVKPTRSKNGKARAHLAADFVHHYGVDLGNVLTQALIGTTFRYGTGLENDFGPGSLRPETGAAGIAEIHTQKSLYGFVGITGRAVAQNIFLDGNTDGDSFSVNREPFVLDMKAGIVLQRGATSITGSFMLQGREFDTQQSPHGVGLISVAFNL